ncbi:hypothetical protein RS24_00949 [Candidatus Micropelagos thuwalensis]|uniref:Uncharacterized protein n=1 Tax=Candidatus Micropelagius thuwalensis TaxID=1397666 RepID=U2WU10_9PROT|nr:hypothetical protein [Candidatus Micropelagos thuwalensis]ERL47018.1 hypothetical protein RS24_00949 [Candidatus Micropelagos thuwalensis]
MIKKFFIFSIGLIFLVACSTTENKKTYTTFPEGSLRNIFSRLEDRTTDDSALLTIINGRCAALNKVVSDMVLLAPENKLSEPLYKLSQSMGSGFLLLARKEGSVVSDYEIRSNEAIYNRLLVSSPEAFREDLMVCWEVFQIIVEAVNN